MIVVMMKGRVENYKILCVSWVWLVFRIWYMDISLILVDLIFVNVEMKIMKKIISVISMIFENRLMLNYRMMMGFSVSLGMFIVILMNGLIVCVSCGDWLIRNGSRMFSLLLMMRLFVILFKVIVVIDSNFFEMLIFSICFVILMRLGSI